MLKGKQKKLDKNKDGKISGEDFKMMKAKYGKMAKKPGGAVLGAVALGVAGALGGKKLLSKKRDTASVAPGAKAASSATPMRSKLLQKAMDDGIFKKAKSGKMMKARYGTMAKGNVSEALQKEKVKKDDNELTKRKLIKKLRGAQVGPAEEAALDKLTPSEVKKKLASMSKAKNGKMIKANKGKDIDIIEAITNKSLMGQGLLTQMKSAAKSAKKKNMGGEMKSTKGYGAARTSGMGLQDESLKSGQNYEITKGGDYIKDLI